MFADAQMVSVLGPAALWDAATVAAVLSSFCATEGKVCLVAHEETSVTPASSITGSVPGKRATRPLRMLGALRGISTALCNFWREARSQSAILDANWDALEKMDAAVRKLQI